MPIMMDSPKIITREERENFPALNSEVNQIYQNKIICTLLDSFPIITLLINNYRQVIYCNRAYLELTKTDPQELVLGLRPGELFGCAFHTESPLGCGESEHCRYCEAVATIRESQVKKEKISREARITLLRDDKEISVDFHITATPFDYSNSRFTIISLEDISHKKRRNVLERVFFHDVIDKVSSLQFAVESIGKNKNTPFSDELIDVAQRLSHELISEILSQRVLLDAENNELKLNISEVSTIEVIQHSIEQIKSHQIASDKFIEIGSFNENCILSTDYLLLNRVLINMLKNALEASEKAEKVTVWSYKNENTILFAVHNNIEMDKKTKAQVFQRSFSTKGFNRGIGTYSMKLLGEQFLQGRVWFDSSADKGTVFYLSVPQFIS
jgi:signal transduction histidine kinase